MECNNYIPVISPVPPMDPVYGVLICLIALMVAIIIMCLIWSHFNKKKHNLKKQQVIPNEEHYDSNRKDTENPDIDGPTPGILQTIAPEEVNVDCLPPEDIEANKLVINEK